MSTTYRKLFSIGITHSYYTDARGGGDFLVRPTPDTLQQLRNHGLRFVSNAGGIYVLYQAIQDTVTEEYTPFLAEDEIDDGLTLRFTMELLNPWFFNITDLDVADTSELRHSIYHFSSSAAAVTMAGTTPDYPATLTLDPPVQLAFRKAAFAYTYTLPGNPPKGTLRVIGPDGATVQTYDSHISPANDFTAFVEMSRLRPGKYGLQKVNNGTPEGATAYFYFDPHINPAATFGVIEVVKDVAWGQVFDYNADPEHDGVMHLDISFGHRAVQWIFKVVFRETDFPDVIEDLTIDEQFVSITPPPINRYHAAGNPVQFYFFIDGDEQDFNGHKMLQFKSTDENGADQVYPIFQETKKNLNLKLAGDTLYGNLPNPDYKNLRNEVIIYV